MPGDKTEQTLQTFDRVEKALSTFDRATGFNCAQSVFTAFSGDFGLDRETALKLSCGLGGGMGRCGQACGAVSGAVMALGLKYGKYLQDDNESKERTYSTVQEFIKQFTERNKTVNCNELVGLDIRTADKQLVKETCANVCPGFVKDAVEIAGSLL